MLALVGLDGFEDRSVTELSGGERQRVALARSLAPAPSLLMLDEPLGSLDRTLRDRLVLDLRELFASQGLTVVYVTHDQSEALALADQVSVLEAGRVVQSASPQQLWARPASPFVARFLGFTNLLDVEVIRGDVHASFGIIGRVSQWPDGRGDRAGASRRDRDHRIVSRSRPGAQLRLRRRPLHGRAGRR